MEKREEYKKRTIRDWIFSYLAVFFVPLLFFVLFMLSGQRSVSREIEESNEVKVEYVAKLFDAAFRENGSLCGELLLDRDIKDLQRDSVSSYDLYEAVQKIRAATFSRNMIDSSFVFSAKDD